MDMSNLIKRTVFGALYVGLILAAILLDNPTLYLTVFSLLAFIGICEYSSLVGLNRTRPLRTILDGLAGVYLVVIFYVGGNPIISLPYLLYLTFVFVRSIYSARELMPEELAKTFLGQIYVALPLASAILLLDADTYVDGGLLLPAFVCIWANDTGAYLAGSAFGKHKLFPSVSPKKSWEGFFGGMIASILALYILSQIISSNTSVYLDLSACYTIIIGGLISVFATWGDLFESMLKRNAGVKDSGNIIPGHGGILDRIDSVLFVLPMLHLVSIVLKHIVFYSVYF